MKDQYINLSEIYQRFGGLGYDNFKKAEPFMNGFPVPVLAGSGKQKGRPRYRRQQFEDWAQGKDLRQILQAALALANQRGEATSASAVKINDLHRRFTAGEFATPEQRQQIALKRLAARTTQPKTTRITIIPDWMKESP